MVQHWRTSLRKGICTDTSLVVLLWGRQFEKVLLQNGWEKARTWECLFVHRQQGLFLSVHVEDIKMTGKEHNLEPMWNRLNKHDVLEKPTIFWIKCTGDALNVNVSQTMRLSTSARSFSNLASAGTIANLPGWEKSHARLTSWCLCCGRTCEEMREKILRESREEKRAIKQSLYTLPSTPTSSKKRNWTR